MAQLPTRENLHLAYIENKNLLDMQVSRKLQSHQKKISQQKQS